ncbi:MAG: aminoacyl-tRNA hydrolase [Candidatus Bipolaricaulota bacterium]
MKAVFGLGNPGLAYALTRHNVGFEAVDLYRSVHRVRARGRVENSALVYSWNDLLLVKPTTFMNESGIAVQGVLRRRGVDLRDALVIYDDLDLPLGRVRLLGSGGAGSHKGMGSVIACLRTEQIPRLRIGIETEGRSAPGADYVLERFTPEEWRRIVPALERAVEAIDLVRERGLDAAMTEINRKLDPL